MLITLKDGRVENLIDDFDIVDLIRETSGDEVADLVEARMKELYDFRTNEREELESDLRSYEMSLQEYESTLDEVQSINQKLWDYIENAKRMNREKMLDKVISIESLIYEVR